jgi:hypothetical protein
VRAIVSFYELQFAWHRWKCSRRPVVAYQSITECFFHKSRKGTVRGTFGFDDDGRANMTAPAEAATWFRLVSVPLENDVAHLGALGDEIGVATSWQLPGVFASNPPDALARVQAKIDSADWGYDPRSGDWAGKAIAAALELDLSDEAQKERCKASLRLGLPQRLCQNQAQQPEAVTATRWLLATAKRERPRFLICRSSFR